MKKYVSLMLCLATCVSLTGCAGGAKIGVSGADDMSSAVDVANSVIDEADSQGSESDAYVESASSAVEESSVAEDNTANLSKYEQVGMSFLNAVQKKDWDTVMTMLPIQTVNFVTPADLDWVLPRTTLSELGDSTSQIEFKRSELTDSDNFIYTIYASCGGSDYTAQVKLMDDNSYKALWDDAMCYDLTLKVPVGITATYGDIVVTSEGLTEKDTYLEMPCYATACSFPRRPITVTITNQLGDSVERECTIPDSKVLTLAAEMNRSTERATQIFNDCYKLYTTLYTLIDQGATDAELLPYFASDVSMDYIKTVRTAHEEAADRNEHKNYEFDPAMNLEPTRADGSLSMLGGDSFYINIQDGISGSLDYGYGAAIRRKEFSPRDIVFIVRYEDGEMKLCNTYGNETYLFGKFH